MRDVAARARTKKLNPEEVQGGTFTITNPGVFGALYGLPLAAGVTIYVAASNLIPESQREHSSIVQLAVFAGVSAYYLLRVLLPDAH